MVEPSFLVVRLAARWMAGLFVLFFGLSGWSYASCSITSGSAYYYTPPVSSLTIARDAAVGKVLYDSGWVHGSGISFQCSGGFTVDYGYTSSRALAPGYTDVYQTGLAGIGIRIQWTNSLTPGGVMTMTSPMTSWNPGISSGQFGPMPGFRVQLLNTGPVTPGVITFSNPVAKASYGGILAGQVSMNSITVNVLSCSVSTSSVAVQMPTALLAAFPAVGSTTGSTPFNINLNCAAGIKLMMTLTDSTSPSNTSGNLSLTSTSTAKGVAYQIKYNGNTVLYGPDSPAIGNTNQFLVQNPTAAGNLSLPFTVSYVRTGTVVAGSANALATFTMSYQ